MRVCDKRYGTELRIYYKEKDPETGDILREPYTVLPPKWRTKYFGYGENSWAGPFLWSALVGHESGHSFTSAQPGPHLGKRIHWNDLPTYLQDACRGAFPESFVDHKLLAEVEAEYARGYEV